MADRKQQVAALEQDWAQNSRWKGIKRGYGAEEVVRLREWAMSTDTGDRDDLVPGVSDRAWRQVSISKPECIGNSCPLRGSCFPILSRQEAEDADVVITNHSILGLESAGVPILPGAGAYVIDEAHDLVDRVTGQLTVSISKSEINSLARLLRREKILATGLESTADGLADVLGELPEGRLTERPALLTDSLLALLGELQQASEDVSSLPGKEESDVAAKNDAGLTALAAANAKGHREVAEYLRRNGAGQ